MKTKDRLRNQPPLTLLIQAGKYRAPSSDVKGLGGDETLPPSRTLRLESGFVEWEKIDERTRNVYENKGPHTSGRPG